jgi:hypothetical protein
LCLPIAGLCAAVINATEPFEELCDQDNRSKSDMFREIFQAYKYHIREKVAQKQPDPLNGDDEQVKNND